MCMGCRKVWGALSILDEFFGTGHICAQPSVMHCNFASDGTIFFCPTKSVSLIKWMTAGLTCCSKQVFWKGPKYESARQHMASVMQACTWFHLLSCRCRKLIFLCYFSSAFVICEFTAFAVGCQRCPRRVLFGRPLWV
mmetsp:Transcript_58391/g.153737  ORF Transcript_58391/g.153737 Transcript_58391/m.153737 type:complete len:138 (+) Transcript_58391:3005-3418(+)